MNKFAVHVLVGALALLVGVAVGGLGPRAQVKTLEKQLEEAAECNGSTMGNEIANVFRGQPWEGDAPSRKRVRRDPVPEPEAAPGEPPADEPEEEGGFQIHFDNGEKPEDLDVQLDAAREAMELRFAQAHEAPVQDANPTDEQLAAIDGTIEAMNIELSTLAGELVAVMDAGQEPSRREMMEFSADALDVFLNAEDQLKASLSPEQVANLQEESLDPLSYVDASIVDTLRSLNR